MIKVYIAGPMRGLPDHNYPAFNSLEAWIDRFGLPDVRHDVVHPVNPARNFGGDPTREYREYMQADLPQLASCDAIVLLSGWENSVGARLEVQVAQHLELDFYHAERDHLGWVVTKAFTPPSAEPWEAATCDRIGGCLKSLGCMTCKCDSPKAPELIEQEAARLVRNGQRQKDYGHPRGDFDTIAALWSPILHAEVTAEQVALCMIGLKMARLTSNPEHHDSLVDVIGYAICYSRLNEPIP